MEIAPKAMEIEYIRIKRFNQEIEKVYATGFDYCHFHNNSKCFWTFIVEL